MLTSDRRVFAIDDDFALPPLGAGKRHRLDHDEPRRERVVETYYDTPDLRLLAAGAVLRRRRGAGGDWLLRAPGGSDGMLELHAAPAGGEPPAELRRMVTGWVGGQPLRAQLTVDTDRTATQLADRLGTPVLELADERSVAERLDDGKVRRWRALELEPLGADRRLTDAVISQLIAAGARPAGEALAYDVALGVTVRPAPAGDVVAARLRQLATELGEQDLLFRQDAPEAVHDFRVTVRRLRSLLRTFRPLLEPSPAAQLRAELGWLGNLLGEARDAEVLEERFAAALAAVPAEEQLGPVRADLVGGVRSTRLAASARLVDELDGDRYRDLVDRLHTFAGDPPYRRGYSGTDSRAVTRAAGRELRRVRNRVAAAEGAADADRDTAYHEARKVAKRVRYAAETLRPLGRKRARRLEQAFKAVQDTLGARNDAVVARRILVAEGAREGIRTGHNGFTYGVLAERERHAVAEADAAFAPAWREALTAGRSWSKRPR